MVTHRCNIIPVPECILEWIQFSLGLGPYGMVAITLILPRIPVKAITVHHILH